MVCVAVYCASRHGDDPAFAADARAVGAALGRAGADHVCIQVIDENLLHLPRTEWRELAAALPL